MTLDEFMKTAAEPEMNYHIGAKSAFFFVGTQEEYEHDIDRLDINFYKIWRTKRKAKKRDTPKTYTMIRDRQVTEIYKRLSNDGIIVSIEGEENGTYYDREEWERTRK